MAEVEVASPDFNGASSWLFPLIKAIAFSILANRLFFLRSSSASYLASLSSCSTFHFLSRRCCLRSRCLVSKAFASTNSSKCEHRGSGSYWLVPRAPPCNGCHASCHVVTDNLAWTSPLMVLHAASHGDLTYHHYYYHHQGHHHQPAPEGGKDQPTGKGYITNRFGSIELLLERLTRHPAGRGRGVNPLALLSFRRVGRGWPLAHPSPSGSRPSPSYNRVQISLCHREIAEAETVTVLS